MADMRGDDLKVDRTSAVVRFHTGVYSIEGIKRAAYRLSGRAVCELVADGAEIVCTVRPLTSDTDPEQLVNQLWIEVLDQDLRQSIAAETEQMRNAILAYAFSRADLPRD
jgi:His-Xaa-Ser system protein HxsD